MPTVSYLAPMSAKSDLTMIQPTTGVDWPVRFTEMLLDQLAQTGLIVIDEVLPPVLLSQLHGLSREPVGYRAAQLIADGVQQQIRSDATRWLDTKDAAAANYLQLLETLGGHLNSQLFLGIRWAEAHFACYQAGQFYAPHRDNPKNSQVRAISTVFYLNPDWQADQGGQLRLVDRQGLTHEILPQDNQLVIFDSDLLHEVCPATQVRYSIAGWLRRDEPPIG